MAEPTEYRQMYRRPLLQEASGRGAAGLRSTSPANSRSPRDSGRTQVIQNKYSPHIRSLIRDWENWADEVKREDSPPPAHHIHNAELKRLLEAGRSGIQNLRERLLRESREGPSSPRDERPEQDVVYKEAQDDYNDTYRDPESEVRCGRSVSSSAQADRRTAHNDAEWPHDAEWEMDTRSSWDDAHNPSASQEKPSRRTTRRAESNQLFQRSGTLRGVTSALASGRDITKAQSEVPGCESAAPRGRSAHRPATSQLESENRYLKMELRNARLEMSRFRTKCEEILADQERSYSREMHRLRNSMSERQENSGVHTDSVRIRKRLEQQVLKIGRSWNDELYANVKNGFDCERPFVDPEYFESRISALQSMN